MLIAANEIGLDLKKYPNVKGVEVDLKISLEALDKENKSVSGRCLISAFHFLPKEKCEDIKKFIMDSNSIKEEIKNRFVEGKFNSEND